jgi:glycosyltransferase involved in cell wall biosynthesis
VKCTACSIATSRGHDEYSSLYRSASRLGYLELVRNGEQNAVRIDAYHALSPHIQETYADFGFPRDKLEVIPNILDERFCREHESDFDEPYELLYVGSLDSHKGVERLIPILEHLSRQSTARFHLTIVGDGGLRSDLERQRDASGVTDDVSFTGWLPNDELPGVFGSHDIFLYPGQWDEPFGRVFLEALAAGTPIVASDVGSVASIIGGGGKTTDGTVDGFVNTILDILDNDELNSMSATAQRQAETYQPDVVVPQLIELYERVLSQ